MIMNILKAECTLFVFFLILILDCVLAKRKPPPTPPQTPVQHKKTRDQPQMPVISQSKFEYEFVTCGSVLKLLNVRNNVRLHSHDVKYGSGSGQQSVTGVGASDDHNSYWQVQAKTGQDCTRGIPINCGDTIRLTHLSTRKNLHSHHFQSPLSNNLEVSAFGDDGKGDEGDNWILECGTEHWDRTDKVRFRHIATDYYLHMTGDTFGRPIHGQREVCTYPKKEDGNYWRAAEGIYVKPTENHSMNHLDDHDEL